MYGKRRPLRTPSVNQASPEVILDVVDKTTIVSRLISLIPPLVKQIELGFGPEWAARRHSLTHESILNRSRIRIVVRRVGHISVIIQVHAVRLHVIDIDFAKHWLNVL
jgi:hypothetical protein